MIEVKAIAPYIGLKDLILDLAQEHNDIKIDVEFGDLKEGLEIAKRAENQGYDVIISRGGTASLIRKHISLPIVEISVTGYDILRSLTLIKEYSGKIGIVGFKNIVEGAAFVSTLLDMDIARYLIEDEEDVETVLHQAMSEGVEVILGDVIATQTANRLGLNGILITSGEESVKEAFDSVYKVYQLMEIKKEKGELFLQLLNSDDRGVILVDKNQQVRFANNIAQEMFPNISLQDAIFPESEIKPYPSIIIQKKVTQILGETMTIYYYVQYDEVKNMFYQFNESKLPQRNEPLANFGQFIKNSEKMKELLLRAKNYALLKNPIMIIGEYGTGKRMLAEAIHNESFLNHGPFVAISFYDKSCEEIEKHLFGTALSPGLFELSQGGTLLLEGIERGSENIYKKILDGNRRFSEVRLIFSSKINIEQFKNLGEMTQVFYHELSPFVLVLPPLRERLEDIADLIRLFLAKWNTKYGKQIVGIKEDVLSELCNYPWYGNIEELQKIMEEVLIQTKGYFIEKKDILFIMDRYKTIENVNTRVENSQHKSEITLSLDKKLEELEQDIIQAILNEEQMNQSKAAKRLGINRTTLWRKMKLK